MTAQLSDTPLTIAVIGAGIGGLTCALALGLAGHEVVVIERRTGFSEIGAGLQISPNASRVLIGLGLGPALARVANEPPGVVIRSLIGGNPIGTVGLGPALRARYGAPYYVLHRADLQTILLDAVRGCPSIRLIVGRDVASCHETEATIELRLRSVDSGREEPITTDFLVAADGVRSALRTQFDDRPFVNHRQAAWRATIPWEAVPQALQTAETGLWLGHRRHVVHYPISKQRLNVVAIVPEREGHDDWGRLGEPSILANHFRDADQSLQNLLALPDSWAVWSLVDRPVARSMAWGRIALLGDAAHPVLPFLAQGAALAIEDAAVLVRCVATRTSLTSALTDYSRARLARVRRVQQAARSNGATYHAGRLKGFVRDRVMRRLGPDGMNRRYEWLYGWTPP